MCTDIDSSFTNKHCIEPGGHRGVDTFSSHKDYKPSKKNQGLWGPDPGTPPLCGPLVLPDSQRCAKGKGDGAHDFENDGPATNTSDLWCGIPLSLSLYKL
ncbi:hypothetical protein TNCV_2168281 [Trichonephila clavipes]|nr:hypothetical protein TNCV_2168281 [Trichonephila clavipes]